MNVLDVPDDLDVLGYWVPYPFVVPDNIWELKSDGIEKMVVNARCRDILNTQPPGGAILLPDDDEEEKKE